MAFKSKSWVCCGGRYPDKNLSGAPNIPGIKYITKVNVIIDKVKRGTDK